MELFSPGARPQKGQVRRGDFWAGKPWPTEKTILRTGGEEYPVGSLGGITAEECGTILGFFLGGEYEPGPAVNGRILIQGHQLSQSGWIHPGCFSAQGQGIRIP